MRERDSAGLCSSSIQCCGSDVGSCGCKSCILPPSHFHGSGNLSVTYLNTVLEIEPGVWGCPKAKPTTHKAPRGCLWSSHWVHWVIVRHVLHMVRHLWGLESLFVCFFLTDKSYPNSRESCTAGKHRTCRHEVVHLTHGTSCARGVLLLHTSLSY